MKRKYFILSIIIVIISSIYLLGIFTIKNENTKITILLKSIVPTPIKNLLKKSIYEKQELKKINTKQTDKIKELEKIYTFKIKSLDYLKKKNNIENFEKIYFEKYTNKKILTDKNIYNLSVYHSPFLYNPIHDQAKGSAFIEETAEHIITVDSIGGIFYIDKFDLKLNKFFAKNIPSNLRKIIKYKNFYEKYEYSIKDILLYKNKIYLSFINELSKDCYNTSIVVSDFNLDFLEFSNFFNPKDCVKKENDTGFFNPHIAGGRIVIFDENNLLFSTGDFQNYKLAQSRDNIFGKILKINTSNSKFEIVSMGHRNVQGLKYDNKKSFIISTEHGPIGGDEVNLNKLNNNKILNFGWPQASYGKHYTSNKEKRYAIAPLYKNHKKYGYEEPLIYYTPSIAISEIENVDNFFLTNDKKIDFFVGSLGKDLDNEQLSIHHLKLDYENSKLSKYDIIKLNERIRDIKYSEDLNLVLMFLESSSSLGILKKLNNVN